MALPLQQLASIYSHFALVLLLLGAHFSSHIYIHPSTDDSLDAKTVFDLIKISNLLEISSESQTLFLGFLFAFAIIISLLLQRPDKLIFSSLACYALPLAARTIISSSELLQVVIESNLRHLRRHRFINHSYPSQIIHYLSSSLAVIHLLYYLFQHIPWIKNINKGVTHLIDFVNRSSLSEIFTFWSSKLFVPQHFLLFWTITFTSQLYENLSLHSKLSWYKLLILTASDSCRSPLTVISIAVTITYISYFLLCTIKFVLSGQNNGRMSTVESSPKAHTGWTEGMTTLLLALLTGLSDLQPQARFAVLTIILFAVLGTLLQSMLEIVEPCILTLSTSGSSIYHHVKVLLLCAFLFLFPIHITWILAQLFPIDFWISIVLTTTLLTSAKILDLVIVHCILWYDSVRKEPWAVLDEAVYYVRAATKVIEFILASCVVWAGLYSNLTTQWNWTNILILIIHCYFNVLVRFQKGYNSFIQRQEAIHKASKLPAATKEQLRENNDVCAICYTFMTNEKESIVIPCKHFFHRICFRRWLCFQERCPLCSVPVQLGDKNNFEIKTPSTPVAT